MRPVQLDDNLETAIGVRRFLQRDGSGRADWYWVANMMIEGKQHARRWSCTKHGDKGAYEKAIAQRQEWEQLKAEKVANAKQVKEAKAKQAEGTKAKKAPTAKAKTKT